MAKDDPVLEGGINSLGLNMAVAARRAVWGGTLSDAVWQTMQRVPAPIAHLDVIHPFPLPVHPMIPLPGDPGAFATSRNLEDR